MAVNQQVDVDLSSILSLIQQSIKSGLLRHDLGPSTPEAEWLELLSSLESHVPSVRSLGLHEDIHAAAASVVAAAAADAPTAATQRAVITRIGDGLGLPPAIAAAVVTAVLHSSFARTAAAVGSSVHTKAAALDAAAQRISTNILSLFDSSGGDGHPARRPAGAAGVRPSFLRASPTDGRARPSDGDGRASGGSADGVLRLSDLGSESDGLGHWSAADMSDSGSDYGDSPTLPAGSSYHHPPPAGGSTGGGARRQRVASQRPRSRGMAARTAASRGSRHRGRPARRPRRPLPRLWRR